MNERTDNERREAMTPHLCPSWCTQDDCRDTGQHARNSGYYHDSDSVGVPVRSGPDGIEADQLFVKSSIYVGVKSGPAPPQVEIQNEAMTVARMSPAAAVVLGQALIDAAARCSEVGHG